MFASLMEILSQTSIKSRSSKSAVVSGVVHRPELSRWCRQRLLATGNRSLMVQNYQLLGPSRRVVELSHLRPRQPDKAEGIACRGGTSRKRFSVTSSLHL